jgi:DNA polymerase
MRQILLQPEFEAWRAAAREALRLGYAPVELDLLDATAPATLSLEEDAPPTGVVHPRPRISRHFLSTAMLAGAHRDPGRWNLLYRVLYRLQGDHTLLTRDRDEDIGRIQHLAAQVRRDLRRMRAEVRFHKVMAPGSPEPHPTVLDEPLVQTNPNEPDPHHLLLVTSTPFGPTKTEIEPCDTPPETECDHYIAWHRPEHRILPLAAPWYARRYAILPWTILTPEASATWNPATKQLTYTPGVPRASTPSETELDELEPIWRTHYAAHASTPDTLQEA